MSDLPLEGVRVLALEHAVAGPIATRHMADLGADVIKIERPGTGDFARSYDQAVLGQSSFFVWLNRGKRSLALDMKAPGADEVLSRLVARSDIVLQNLAPGATERLGLGWDRLHAANPRVILCEISGFGNVGPYAGRKSYDLLIQAEAGLMGVTGTAETPCRAGTSIADIATGQYALSGCLAALIRRGRTGKGAHVEVTMLDALSEWMGAQYNHARYGAGSPERRPSSHPSLAPYGLYRVADGALLVGIQNDREFATFCARVLEDASIAADMRFTANVDRVRNTIALDALIGPVLGRMTADQAERRLNEAGIACGRVREAGEAAAHPQTAARGRWQPVETPGGQIDALAPVWTLDGAMLPMAAVPSIGQHTAEILAEIAA